MKVIAVSNIHESPIGSYRCDIIKVGFSPRAESDGCLGQRLQRWWLAPCLTAEVMLVSEAGMWNTYSIQEDCVLSLSLSVSPGCTWSHQFYSRFCQMMFAWVTQEIKIHLWDWRKCCRKPQVCGCDFLNLGLCRDRTISLFKLGESMPTKFEGRRSHVLKLMSKVILLDHSNDVGFVFLPRSTDARHIL